MSRRTVLVCDAPECGAVLKDGAGYELRIVMNTDVKGAKVPGFCGLSHACDLNCLKKLIESKSNG